MGNLDSKKYHVTDDGKVYRINDDGSFTELGNADDLENQHSTPQPASTTAPANIINKGGKTTSYPHYPKKSGEKNKMVIVVAIIVVIGLALMFLPRGNGVPAGDIGGDSVIEDATYEYPDSEVTIVAPGYTDTIQNYYSMPVDTPANYRTNEQTSAPKPRRQVSNSEPRGQVSTTSSAQSYNIPSASPIDSCAPVSCDTTNSSSSASFSSSIKRTRTTTTIIYH